MTKKDHVWDKSQGEHLQALHWGAVPVDSDQWQFAHWAPSAQEVMLALDSGPAVPLTRDANGTFWGRFSARHGMDYEFITDGTRMADPAARWQRAGVTGPSRLLDPARLRGPAGPATPLDEAVISEVHIGSFTPEGTFAAAARAPQLKRLAELGITMIELMPLGQFPGSRGWGYDSVLPWAPHHAYGPPEHLRLLVDAVHALGMQVCLDVVFNHFGAEGCMLVQTCPEFFHDHSNDWGRAIDFDRPEVRAYFTGCAIWWLETYGFDALRFDALHAMESGTHPGIITHLAHHIRTHPFDRPVHLIAEDNRNLVWPYLPENAIFHAVWNDDYHHAQHVVLTGETFGYYQDFSEEPLQDMARAMRDGYAHQGEPHPAGDVKCKPSTALPPQSFVAFNLNHDHAGNRPRGARLLSLVGQDRAMIAHALLLTSPSIPLLFMGEEIGAETPFPWFADYKGDIADTITRERARLFEADAAPDGPMADPFDPTTMAKACPYLTLSPHAAQWQQMTDRLTTLRRRKLLPIWRSGRIALPEIRISNPSAIASRSLFRDAAITTIACFSAQDRIVGSDRPLPLLQIGTPDKSPFFALWLDPASSDTENDLGICAPNV